MNSKSESLKQVYQQKCLAKCIRLLPKSDTGSTFALRRPFCLGEQRCFKGRATSWAGVLLRYRFRRVGSGLRSHFRRVKSDATTLKQVYQKNCLANCILPYASCNINVKVPWDHHRALGVGIL